MADSPDIDGVRLHSIDVVDQKDPTDTESFGPHSSPLERMLKVSLASRVGLIEYSRRFEYNPGYRAFGCADWGIDEKRLRGSYIYDNNGIVDNSRKEESLNKGTQTDDHVYRIYIYIKSVPQLENNGIYRNSFRYDLHREPQDVCIRLRGGNMLGFTFEANTVVIPKELISAAFWRAKRQDIRRERNPSDASMRRPKETGAPK